MGSERKAKRARMLRQAKEARRAAQAMQANPDLAELGKLPELLKQATEVNEALMAQNEELQKKIDSVLENHETRITALEEADVEA